jgi:hypothetical protein
VGRRDRTSDRFGQRDGLLDELDVGRLTTRVEVELEPDVEVPAELQRKRTDRRAHDIAADDRRAPLEPGAVDHVDVRAQGRVGRRKPEAHRRLLAEPEPRRLAEVELDQRPARQTTGTVEGERRAQVPRLVDAQCGAELQAFELRGPEPDHVVRVHDGRPGGEPVVAGEPHVRRTGIEGAELHGDLLGDRLEVRVHRLRRR